MSQKPHVCLVQHNHFDPIWRRGWKRSFDYLGKRYRPYAELEELFFNIWLDNAKSGASVSEGQALVIRTFLERNPERLEEVRELVRRGRIELTAAGEVVPDTNMPSGETLLRNLVIGQLWFEEAFGVIPSDGWLEDAFGQSAQMPQIFRGCECDMVHRLSYKRVPGTVWTGLDGTPIFTGQEPRGGGAGHCVKIPPCPVCQGMGCAQCQDTGLEVERGFIPDADIQRALGEDFSQSPFWLLAFGGEEAVPSPHLPEIASRFATRADVAVEWGGFHSIAQYYAEEIARMKAGDFVASNEVEANPVSTGCYVSRIRIKQEFRRIENILNVAERWAAVAYLHGADYPEEALLDAWRDLSFVAFHDAITSTHIDQAYFEILDILGHAEHEAGHVLEDALESLACEIAGEPEQSIAIFNADSWQRNDPVSVVLEGVQGVPRLTGPNGTQIDILDCSAEGEMVQVTFAPPEVPALGFATVHIQPDSAPINIGDITAGPGEISNEFFRISCSASGIESVSDVRTGEALLSAADFRVGELILEEDIGHPWGTMQAPAFREGLGDYTTRVTIRKASKCQEIALSGQYRGQDSGTHILSWRQSVKLYAGVDRIDFKTEIDWDSAQRRIRMAFPTGIATSEATYSIPYGALRRAAYTPDMTQFPSTNGDWPAVNWVDVHCQKSERGVALVNTGTPSHCVEEGLLLVSLLRSPADRWCLNEPEYYDCPDFDGARDAGSHVFHHTLIPHKGDFREALIERRAREINAPLQPHMPQSCSGKLGERHSYGSFQGSDNILLTALMKSYRDDSVVARLAETSGQKGSMAVRLEGAANEGAQSVNFLEREAEPQHGPLEIGGWKIATLKIPGK